MRGAGHPRGVTSIPARSGLLTKMQRKSAVSREAGRSPAGQPYYVLWVRSGTSELGGRSGWIRAMVEVRRRSFIEEPEDESQRAQAFSLAVLTEN